MGKKTLVTPIDLFIPVYTVKNVKTFRGREGEGYNATLFRDGRKVALVMDDANGGESRFEWLDYKEPRVTINSFDYKDNPRSYQGTPEEKILAEYCCTLFYDANYGIPELDGKHRQTPDIFVEGIINKYLQEKRTIKCIKQWSKRQTLFRLKGDKDGSFRMMSRPHSEQVQAHILNTHGNTVECIYDDKGEMVFQG